MGLAGFNRMRRLKTQQATEEAARLEAQKQEQEKAEEEAAKTETPVPENNLDDMPYQELRAIAKEREIEGYHKMNTEELREALKEGG